MMFVVVIAIAASLVLTPVAARMARRFGAVSCPDGQRRLHARPTPLWGGTAVFGAVLLGIIVAYGFALCEPGAHSLPAALALSASLLCLLGCCDDVRQLRARWKLLGQIAAIVPVLLAGCYIERIGILGNNIELGPLGPLVTMGWLLLGINALNLLDGMDGLASMTGIAISLAVAVIAWSQGRFDVMLLALTVAGAAAGFLAHNLPPARVYLGDCGSTILGLSVALLAQEVSIVAPGTARLTVAAALLFVPILDTSLAIVRRSLSGRGLAVGDRGHVHHRLLDRGFSVWNVLAVLGSFCLITGVMAWTSAVWQQDLPTWLALAAVVVVAANRQLMGHEEWRLTKQWIRRTAAGWAARGRIREAPQPLRVAPETLRVVTTEEPVMGRNDWVHSLKHGEEKKTKAAA